MKRSKTGKQAWPKAAFDAESRGLSLAEAFQCGELVENKFADVPIRQLPEREGLAINHVTLVRARAAYRVLQSLGYTPESSPLSFAHLRQLDHLPPKEQRSLAKQVAAEGLSAKQLERIIRGRKGVSTVAGFQLALRALESFEDGRFNLLLELDRAAELNPEDAAHLLKRAKSLHAQLELVSKTLKG